MPVWNWGQPINGIIQVAHTTDNIEKSMEEWTSRLHIGPWFLFEHFQFQWLKYRGQPSDLDVTIALANSGGMMFELIQQNDALPSVYREVKEVRGNGFHHWAVAARPEEYESVLDGYVKGGDSLVLEGAVAIGARAAYVDCLKTLGGMIEVIEVTPAVEGLFTMIQQASVGWDGAAPVRVLQATDP